MPHAIAELIVERLITTIDGTLELPIEAAVEIEKKLSAMPDVGHALIAILDVARAAEGRGQGELAATLVALAATQAGSLGLHNALKFSAVASASARIMSITGRLPRSLDRDNHPVGTPIRDFKPVIAIPRRA